MLIQLNPNLSDEKIAGLVNITYKEFEKITPASLINLNKTDRDIYKSTWNLAKQIVNNNDGAKGHKGDSKLSMTDIAHNYALNVSLIQKLITMNKESSDE